MTTTTAAKPIVRQKVEQVRVIRTGGGCFAVTAVSVSGARFHLRHVFRDEASAHSVAAKVACRGSLDAALWDLVAVEPNSAAEAHLQATAAADRATRLQYEAERALAA